MILLQDEKFVVNRFPSTESPPNLRNQEPLPEAESKPDFRFEGYAMPNDICPPVPSTVPQSLAVIPYNPIAEDAVDEAFQGDPSVLLRFHSVRYFSEASL